MSNFFTKEDILFRNLLDDSGESDEYSDDDDENIDSEKNSVNLNDDLSSQSHSDEETPESLIATDLPQYFTIPSISFHSSLVRSETVEMIDSSATFTGPMPMFSRPIMVQPQNQNVFGRAKKDPYKWQTVANFNEKDLFFENNFDKINSAFDQLQNVEDFFS